MKKTVIYHSFFAFAATLLMAAATAGCTDDLTEGTLRTDGHEDGISFGLSVAEQASLAYNYGGTRSGASASGTPGTVPGPRTFDGDDMGLGLHALSLPVMGIHPRGVNSTYSEHAESSGRSDDSDSSGSSSPTRASVADIVSAGSDPLNFHDSLTVWGFTDRGRPLFRQILLKKVRGWRSSVHWPYDHEVIASWASIKGYEAAHDGADWLNPATMRFYAIAPSLEDQELQVTNSSSISYATPPHFWYQVPDNPDAQRDLLYGVSGDIDIQAGPDGTGHYADAETPRERHLGEDDKEVGLTFRHLLTAVRFAQGKIPAGVKVKSIKLNHIVNQGTYYPDEPDRVVLSGVVSESDKGWWRLVDAEGAPIPVANYGNYEIKTDWESENYTTGGENVYIDQGQVLFLMPHTVSTAAELEVTLEIELKKDNEENTISQNRTVTLKTSLAGDVWKKGYTVTYYLTIGKVAQGYYLIADPNVKTEEHSTSSTTGSFNIHSYRHYLDYSEVEAATQDFTFVPWEITGFYTKDALGNYESVAKPGWLSSIKGWSTSGGTSEEITSGETVTGKDLIVNYTLAPQSFAYTANHADVLQNNTRIVRASDSPFDLSTYCPDGTAQGKEKSLETANCYIINAQGNYSFPLVYGNGNSACIGEGSIFKDHAGYSITSADILTQVNRCVDSDVTSEYVGYGKVTKTEEYFYDKVNRQGEYEGDLTAELLWQDTDKSIFSNLIVNKDAHLNTTIRFSVGENLRPCNAVIALKGKKRIKTTIKKYTNAEDATPVESTATWTPNTQESGALSGSDTEIEPDILWLWHIWITDEVYPNSSSVYAKNVEKNDRSDEYWVDRIYPSYHDGTKIPALQDFSGTPHNILPVNLGWVPDPDYMDFGIYHPRDIWVEIQQTQGDADPVKVQIHQDAYQQLITGTSTIYQWGRPTALPMVLTTKTQVEHPVYNANGTRITQTFTLAEITDFQQAITEPRHMVRLSSPNTQWFPTSGNHGYWNNGGALSGKTIYDPCPPGFYVPQLDIFKGLSRTGDNSTSDNQKEILNIWPNSASGGYKSADKNWGGYFYTTKYNAETFAANRYGPMFYFPATGEWKPDWTITTTESRQLVHQKSSSDETNAQSHLNQSQGVYWMSDYTDDDDATTGKALWFRPEWNYTGSTKVIDFGKTESFGYAMPVRPAGNY